MNSSRPSISRRRFLVHGLAGTSVAVVGTLAGSSAAGGASAHPAGDRLLEAAVDLKIDSNAPSLVTGTVNGMPVDAKGSVYGGPHGGPATVTGSLAGHPLEAILTLRDQVPHGSGYVTTARITASVGNNALVASGTFRLDADYLFVNGDITGTDRGLTIDVSAKPRSPSGSVGYAAKVKGEFGNVPVAIAADAEPGRPGSVVGSVGGNRVDLRIHPDHAAGGSTATRLTGTYSGPPELLALIVGAVAFFVG